MKITDKETGKKVDIDPKEIMVIEMKGYENHEFSYQVTMMSGCTYIVDNETEHKLQKAVRR